MRHVTTIASREFRSLFVSPVAYVILSLIAGLAGMFFVLGVAAFNMSFLQAQQFQAYEQLQQMNLNDHVIRYYYDTMSVVLMIVIPGITMGLFASEKSNGTQELLLTSPLTIWDIVLGKFGAAAAFVSLLVALIGLYPALLFMYGTPEVGRTATGVVGLLLAGWTYVAIGAFASSITRNQVVAFLVAFVLLLCLSLLKPIANLGVAGVFASGLMEWLSTADHFGMLRDGVVDTSDLVYFVVAIGSFLLLTKSTIESVRWR